MRIALAVAAIAVSLSLTGGTAAAGDHRPRTAPRGWVDQVGTYDYLVSPDYDGLAPIAEAASGATIGLGTFDRLAGELVIVDGVAYRVAVDGRPREVPMTRTTPFAEAIDFQPQSSQRVRRGTSCADLPTLIDASAGTAEGIVAVRVHGQFRRLETRSVKRQHAPYPPLTDVVASQVTFDLDGREATLVGFRTGPDLAGVGAPGLHLHGITADRSAGGHVLSCVTGRGVTMELQRARGVRVRG